MDPHATLNSLIDAIMSGESDDAAEHASNLADWIKGGGFVPQALTDARTLSDRDVHDILAGRYHERKGGAR